MKNLYQLQIWKLDIDHELMADDPHFDQPFMAMKHEVSVKSKIMGKDHAPAFNCCGYRVIVKDARANEVHTEDVMFVEVL